MAWKQWDRIEKLLLYQRLSNLKYLKGLKNQINKRILCNIGLNEGQSEPVGTCEKQEKRSFSLSIRYVAKLARACPKFRPILRRKTFWFFTAPLISFTSMLLLRVFRSFGQSSSQAHLPCFPIPFFLFQKFILENKLFIENDQKNTCLSIVIYN